ncbi:MAG: hypothetical protein ORN24_03585 [Burkholderiales bacterium]|nr:hypothetical protein [Burkholderiales bacterium]
MLFFKEYKNCYKQLTTKQKLIVSKDLIFLNLVFLVLIIIFSVRIHTADTNQLNYIKNNSVSTNATNSYAKTNNNFITRAYITDIKEFSLKDTSVAISFILSTMYSAKDFPTTDPDIELANGKIISRNVYYKTIESGMVHEVIAYEATVDPLFNQKLYPLDQQIILINPIAKNWSNKSYNVTINQVNIESNAVNPNHAYRLVKYGYSNSIDSMSMKIGHTDEIITNKVNSIYLIFNHKNIYSYIKNIQYILLGILIAVLTLFVNGKNSSTINGRISVIGSSVFSLAANVFQINASLKATNSFNLIDFITLFAGLIIMISFITIIKATRLMDTDNYETSRTYELTICYTLLLYIAIFFISIYVCV